jgi:hypothetical protein
VFFWSHDGESDVPSYDNVTLVAGTFAELIDGLETAAVKWRGVCAARPAIASSPSSFTPRARHDRR